MANNVTSENIFQRVGHAILERTGYHFVRHDILEDLIDRHEQSIADLQEDIKVRQTAYEDLQGQCDKVTEEKNNLHVEVVQLAKEKEVHLETIRLLTECVNQENIKLTTQAIQHSNNIEAGLQLIEELQVTPVRKPRGKKVTAHTNGN